MNEKQKFYLHGEWRENKQAACYGNDHFYMEKLSHKELVQSDEYSCQTDYFNN
jgi:hypothetical protein